MSSRLVEVEIELDRIMFVESIGNRRLFHENSVLIDRSSSVFNLYLRFDHIVAARERESRSSEDLCSGMDQQHR